MEYDEIRITTRREVAVCLGAISKLENCLAALEEKYHLSNEAFRQAFLAGELAEEKELVHWFQCCLALDRWRQRLREHQVILSW